MLYQAVAIACCRDKTGLPAILFINNINKGMNQTGALMSASTALGRTINACAFRLKNNLRIEYEESLKQHNNDTKVALNDENNKLLNNNPVPKTIIYEQIIQKDEEKQITVSWEIVQKFFEDNMRKIEQLELLSQRLLEENESLKLEISSKKETALTGDEYRVLMNLVRRTHDAHILTEEPIDGQEKIG